SITCASATAPPNPNARCICKRSPSIPGPIRYGSAGCWSARSDRCAGRRIRPTAPPPKCCRWLRRRRAAARSFSIISRFRVRISEAPRNDGLLLLAVVGQDLFAGLGEPGAVLLQARQHDLIVFMYVRPAKARDIAGAGVMPLLRLRGKSRHKQRHEHRNDEEKPDHLLRLFGHTCGNPCDQRVLVRSSARRKQGASRETRSIARRLVHSESVVATFFFWA